MIETDCYPLPRAPRRGGGRSPPKARGGGGGGGDSRRGRGRAGPGPRQPADPRGGGGEAGGGGGGGEYIIIYNEPIKKSSYETDSLQQEQLPPGTDLQGQAGDHGMPRRQQVPQQDIEQRDSAFTPATGCASPMTRTGRRTGTCSSPTTRTASQSGTTRCARFSNRLHRRDDTRRGESGEMRGIHGGEDPVRVDGKLCYRIILDNPIPKGLKAIGAR